MSTRPLVEAAIAAIDNGGNNTAEEVRDVLTKLLDYTENEAAPPQQLISFNYFTEGPINDQRTGSELQYSCRGFEGEDGFANFTFQLQISDNSDGNVFLFPLQEDHAEDLLRIMETILPTDAMRFSIPFKVIFDSNNGSNEFSFSIPTTILFSSQTVTTGNGQVTTRFISFDMDFSIASGGVADFSLTNALAYTSVCFHSNERIIEPAFPG